MIDEKFILDVTAGNRVIWQEKNGLPIVYLDIERQLERKPTVFADSQCSPFKDGIFHTIFFDPPYAWAFDSMFYSFPNEKMQKEKYKTLTRNGIPSYYGMERYRTRTELLAYLFRTEKELRRVLTPDGILWLKWNELRLPLNRILVVFSNWLELMRLEIADKHQQLSKIQTFWVALYPKPTHHKTVELESFLELNEP